MSTTSRGILLFISGPTGSGKSFLVDKIRSRYSDMFDVKGSDWGGEHFGFIRYMESKVGPGGMAAIESPNADVRSAREILSKEYDILHLFFDLDYATWIFHVHANDRFKLKQFKAWNLSLYLRALKDEAAFDEMKKGMLNPIKNSGIVFVHSTDEALAAVDSLVVANRMRAVADFEEDIGKRFEDRPRVFHYQGFDFGFPGMSRKGVSAIDKKWTLLGLDRVDFFGKSVLDIGCNNGAYSFRADEQGAAFVMGLEMDEAYCESARFLLSKFRKDSSARFVHGSFMGHDFCGEKFDYVLVVAVLHHIADSSSLDAAVKKISGLCSYMAVFEVAERVRDEGMTKEFILEKLRANFQFAYLVGPSIGCDYGKGSDRWIFRCYN